VRKADAGYTLGRVIKSEGSYVPDANIDIVIDCADPETLAEFWAEALAYDKLGLFDNYYVLVARNRAHPPTRFCCNAYRAEDRQGAHPFSICAWKTRKPKPSASKRLALAVSTLAKGPTWGWIAMADPEGNEFCVCAGIPLPGESSRPDDVALTRGRRDVPVVASDSVNHLAVRALAVGLAMGAIVSCSSSSKPHAAPISNAASSTAAPTTTTTVAFGPAKIASQQQLPGGYNQGVAGIPGGWIFSATDSLWRTDDNLKVLKHISPAIPAAWKAKGFDHVGDVDVVGKYIYAPFEQPDYAKQQQATARYDRDTLRFVDAVMLPQNENSFVTIDPKTMIAYTMRALRRSCGAAVRRGARMEAARPRCA